VPNSLIDIEAAFLPRGQMRQISRITQLEGPSITGEVDLRPDHWVYALHFPGDPLFPGALMIEAAAQVVGLWAWAQGQRGRLRLARTSAEFHHPVTPANKRLVLRAEVRRRRHLNFGTIAIWAAGTRMATVDVVLAVLPAEA
jgi:3-hydroxyacyl-[acyl-carrier protein] dehydratase / trans-2-decenoyl-[acyl-carrier protein] isomerase